MSRSVPELLSTQAYGYIGATLRDSNDKSSDLNSSVNSAMLQVELMGPPLLFRGILPVIYSFPAVASVRQVPVLPDSNIGSLHHLAPFPDLNCPTRRVSVYWHECLSSTIILCQDIIADKCHGSIVLFGATIPEVFVSEAVDVATKNPMPIVQLSIYDVTETWESGLCAAGRGEAFSSPLFLTRIRNSLPQKTRQLRLTHREREIAVLAAEGLSNEEIAEQLFLCVPTIKSHLNRIYFKLGVVRRGQLSHALHRNQGIIARYSDDPSSGNGRTPSVPISKFTDTMHIHPEYVDIICHTKDGFLVNTMADALIPANMP
jgi:DNA-binding CsgD family transcriptional regulator